MNRRYGHLVEMVLAFFALTLLAVLAVPSGTASPLLKKKVGQRMFLPLVAEPPASVIGYVTENGSPAPNVPLSLLRFDGGNWVSSSIIETDALGKYEFQGLEALRSGQTYQVQFTGGPDRIGHWWTPMISQLPGGATFQNRTFDIGWVNPDLRPVSDSTVSLPVTFTWNRRAASPSDSYQLHLQTGRIPVQDGEPVQGDLVFFETGLLGYANSYTLEELPPGFAYGVYYRWYLTVHSPAEDDAGYGASWRNDLRFTAPG